MEIKTVGLASDHAGFALKQYVKKYLDERNMPYKDYGTFTEESCDYPDLVMLLHEVLSQAKSIQASASVVPEKVWQ